MDIYPQAQWHGRDRFKPATGEGVGAPHTQTLRNAALVAAAVAIAAGLGHAAGRLQR